MIRKEGHFKAPVQEASLSLNHERVLKLFDF